MNINIINNTDLPNPKYSNEGDVGMDLRADILEPITLQPFERALISTGICIELPEGYEGQVRGRSGLAIKHGIGIVNGLGTIDPNYKDEIGVILINLGNEPFTINRADRIAQLVINKFEKVELINVECLNGSNRGGGFGSTGR